jgi:hypothetical protein
MGSDQELNVKLRSLWDECWRALRMEEPAWVWTARLKRIESLWQQVEREVSNLDEQREPALVRSVRDERLRAHRAR